MLTDIKLKQPGNNDERGNRIHPHKFTMWVAIGSMLMLFAGLTSAYIVKSNQDNWVSMDTPKQFWYSTAVIILSSITMQMAVRAFKQREMNKYRKLILLTTGLGILFVVLQWLGFKTLWDNNIRLT